MASTVDQPQHYLVRALIGSSMLTIKTFISYVRVHWKWTMYCILAFLLLVVLILVSVNSELRGKVQRLLFENKLKTLIQSLKVKAAASIASAKVNKQAAQDAIDSAKDINSRIGVHKRALKSHYKDQGLTANEISDRFNNLNM